jgi:hypothetical protein
MAAMEPRPIRCRRARRTDAEAVLALLDGGAGPGWELNRAGRHRFRQLVADLGADCYVAVRDETVVGLVHVTYARHLLDGQRATVELLLAAPGEGAVPEALAHLLGERARRRRCRAIDWRGPADDATARAVAERLGARAVGEHLRVEIPAAAD